MPDETAPLKRAQELFQGGKSEQAEEIVSRLVKENPRDTTALNFRAYLLYRKGDLNSAMEAYRRLTELEPRVAAHYANLGLICFKGQRYLEAQGAFEHLLELQPGDVKALRNLGFCHERQQALEKALDCFTRAGDVENADKIQERLGGSAGAEQRRAGAPPAPAAPAAAAVRPAAALEPDITAWLESMSLPRPGEGAELVRAGTEELVMQVREKIFVNPSFCSAHRGVMVFAPAFREAEKAASKFGARRGVLARAEGNGELVLSGCGRGLHALHLGRGRIFVNWPALVLCGTEITVSFEYTGWLKEVFLAVELNGAGPVVLAARGAPVVLPVLAELPTFVRPQAVVAWTDDLVYEPEVVPELRNLVGKEDALRYRFEGRGFLVLQSS